MSIGNRIREERRRLGLSQVALANLLGVSQGCIAWVEKGRSHTIHKLERLAEILEVNPHWLETGEGDSTPQVELFDIRKIKNNLKKETIEIIELVEKSDEITRGKLLYAVKEMVQLREIMMNSARLNWDNEKILKGSEMIKQWVLNVNDEVPRMDSQHNSSEGDTV